METMMIAYIPYLTAAALMAGILLCAYLYAQMRETQDRLRFFKFANDQIEGSLTASDRVLANHETPERVREVLLIMLNLLKYRELGEAFVQFLSEPDDNLSGLGENKLVIEMEELHRTNPSLANDAHRALMGLTIFAIPLKYPVQYQQKEIVTEYAGKGATDPDSVFARVNQSVPRLVTA